MNFFKLSLYFNSGESRSTTFKTEVLPVMTISTPTIHRKPHLEEASTDAVCKFLCPIQSFASLLRPSERCHLETNVVAFLWWCWLVIGFLESKEGKATKWLWISPSTAQNNNRTFWRHKGKGWAEASLHLLNVGSPRVVVGGISSHLTRPGMHIRQTHNLT